MLMKFMLRDLGENMHRENGMSRSCASPQCVVLKRSPPVASLIQGTVIIVINGIVKHYLFLVGVIAKDDSF